MLCDKCGAIIEADDKFCPSCGAVVDMQPADGQNQHEENIPTPEASQWPPPSYEKKKEKAQAAVDCNLRRLFGGSGCRNSFSSLS